MAESLTMGFDLWVQTDYVALKEATRDKPDECTSMVMEFPGGRQRRVIFGPVAHHVEHSEVHEAAAACSTDDDSDDHPFCPCCLFTRSIKAFQPMVESDEFFGLRLFAARHEDGTVNADCRVNGHDNKKGMSALKRYVKTWPEAGFEFRKQYVIIHNQ